MLSRHLVRRGGNYAETGGFSMRFGNGFGFVCKGRLV
jgi:hypothetical protein